MHNLWRLLNNNSMKTKEWSDYNFNSWPSVFHKVYRWELDSLLVSQTLGPRPQYARYSDLLSSVPYFWRNNIANIRWPVPCCFYSIVFGNFWCVLCFVDNRFSGCWRAFPCCFHTTGLLRRDLRISGQDLPSVLCIIFFMVGFLTNNHVVFSFCACARF